MSSKSSPLAAGPVNPERSGSPGDLEIAPGSCYARLAYELPDTRPCTG
jgi:hypothetical protein